MTHRNQSDRMAPILLILALLAPATLAAQTLPCKPCGGLRTEDPAAALEALRQSPPLEEGQLLVIAWKVELDGAATAAPATDLAQAGAVPWITLTFHTPAPLLERVDALSTELEAAARVVRGAPPGSWFQVAWEPEIPPEPAEAAAEYAFLLKRAGVAITGASGAGGRVVSRPLSPDPETLTALYEQEVAAYLDAVALAPASDAEITAAVATLLELDPGKPVVLDATPTPDAPELALAEAAHQSTLGIALSLFDAPHPDAAVLAPLTVLARELAGDLSYDPYSTPTGAEGTRAWAFVRGEDLGLRVIAAPSEAERQAGELSLSFSDTQLRRPVRVRLESGDPLPLAGERRSRSGFELVVADPGALALLRLERPTLVEMAGPGGLAEELTVESERQMPVEEILRRLQAFEDAQNRRLDHYRAINQTHLRFQFGTGTQTLETTYEGAFFFRQGEGFDWAWQTFYVNGVKWRSKKIPEIPLIRPEKAAAMPLEIAFNPEYRYRLRGTADIDGRDCWVVDFKPLAIVEGESLYQGTVWIDRQLYARVRTRTVQLGLTGDVISNEETLDYTPVDEDGQTVEWSAEAYVLPLHSHGQEIFSLLNGTSVVEKETILSAVEINGADFEAQRQAILDSELTMVRDTEKGLRYLIKDKATGERVVETEPDTSRLFLAGGVFFDESLDFPLPLAGINYFNFDWRGTGSQVNALFAGPLLTANLADPSLFGSRWDAGADLFALAVSTTDDLFRDDREVPEEAVQQRVADLDLNLGRPIGSFFKLNLSFGLRSIRYSDDDETAPDFVLPEDHLDSSVTLQTRYSRKGWRASAAVSFHDRSDWQPWGLPGDDTFDPETKDYLLWDVSLGKNWYLSKFRKVGAEIQYVDGEDLDRFSKYEFGFFSDVRVHGYQSDRVRAEEALAAHLTYGFEVGQYLRLDGVADAAWASDEASGLDRELLAGVGLSGTVVGPWRTLVNLDLGVPVAGPDDGFSIFLVFLKLFR